MDLDLTNGLWEMAVDRVILPNRQNNALKLKISNLLVTKEIKEIDFTPGVYDDTYEVLDEFINLGENTELDLEFNEENYGKDEFLFGDFDTRYNYTRNLHVTFPLSVGIKNFKQKYNREISTLFDVWLVMELCTELTTQLGDSNFYFMYQCSGDVKTNPENVFKTDSNLITGSVKYDHIMTSVTDFNKKHLQMKFFTAPRSKNGYYPYFWVSENLANALKLDKYSSFYHLNQDIIRFNNPNNGKTGFLFIHKSMPATTYQTGY